MAKKEKVKTAAFEVPKDAEQVNADILEIGELQRERLRIEADMNDELAPIKQKYEDEARPVGEDLAALVKGVHAYCETHRDELTKDGKVKFHDFGAGRVQWRMTPPKANITKADDVIAALERLGLEKFIRSKQEIDKEAMLKEPDAVQDVKGVSIGQKEMFGIEPFGAELEEIAA